MRHIRHDTYYISTSKILPKGFGIVFLGSKGFGVVFPESKGFGVEFPESKGFGDEFPDVVFTSQPEFISSINPK
jgi:hypothetical protein